MRKRLEQSRLDNPNWLQKINLQELKRIELNFTECFLDNPRVVKFSDDLIVSSSGLNMAYSSTGLNK